METEVWKDILEVGGMYQISSFGKVMSKEKIVEKKNGVKDLVPERIIKPFKGNQSYLGIKLTYNSKYYSFLVHRLVGLYFIENPKKFDVIRFKDGNRKNCRADNLIWISSAEYKLNKKHPPTYVEFDELSELWDVIINKQYFASYPNKEKAEEVLRTELERRNRYGNFESPLRRNIIPQRANKIFRSHSQFILN